MKRIKPVAGLLVLCGLCFCAFGASNASALTLHECKEATSGETTKEYEDKECKTAKVGGKFRTVPLPENTAITPTLTETPGSTAELPLTTGETAGTHAVLHVVGGGISFQITCTGLTSGDSTVTNKLVGETMTFEGTGTTEFSGCTVKTPTQCTVPTTLKTALLKQTTSGMSVIFKPNSGTTFITIPVSGASCPAAFKGEKAITGEAVATVSESNVTSLTFNSKSGNNLKFGGIEGAQFTATIHFKRNSNGALLGAETP